MHPGRARSEGQRGCCGEIADRDVDVGHADRRGARHRAHALVRVAISVSNLSATYAPLLVTACMLPLTYVMSKIVLETTNRLNKPGQAGANAAKKP